MTELDLINERVKYLETWVKQQQEMINLMIELLKVSEKAREYGKTK